MNTTTESCCVYGNSAVTADSFKTLITSVCGIPMRLGTKETFACSGSEMSSPSLLKQQEISFQN